MVYPKVNFVSTLEIEKQRLLQIAIYIVNRFWQQKGFLLLPYDVKNFSGREIYFPDLPYPKSFWESAKQLSKNPNLLTMPLGITPEITLLDTFVDANKLKLAWEKVEKDFWDFCFSNFPDYFQNIKTFEVWVTKYKRLSSFAKGHAWVHFESSPGDIAESILASVFRPEHVANGYTWEESEAFIDNLISLSKLKKLFPDWKPTLVGMRSKQIAKHTADSKAYFQKLGYKDKPIFSFSSNQIMLENSPLTNRLTATEYEILKQLLTNSDKIVSFETIGDIIWKEKCLDNYSEWAIAKTIQRLRSKISSLGITPEVIQTKRGQGYWLVN